MNESDSKHLQIIGLVAGCFAGFCASATELPVSRVDAKPIKQPGPIYPVSELQMARQGWVDVSFVVTEDGSVTAPVVEASSGSARFERAALKAVAKWRYEPALQDGVPVEQSKTRVRVAFALADAQTAVSPAFHREHERISRILDRGDLDTASERLDKAFKADNVSLAELAWLWTLKARIAGAQGDSRLQLNAVRQALAVSEDWMPRELRASLLQVRSVREAEIGNYAAALDAYEVLREFDENLALNLAPTAKEIRALVESDRALAIAAEIGSDDTCDSCKTHWFYQPMRRAIEIADVEGSLDDIELRCDWRRFVDRAREGVAWEIPESWGDCTVVVSGETGSTFKLVELPAS